MSDVVELIQADHRRTTRLFSSLGNAACLEPGGYPHTAGPVWDRLAGFLSLHADAEQEICFLAMFRYCEHRASEIQEATADLDDLRETGRAEATRGAETAVGRVHRYPVPRRARRQRTGHG